PTPSPTAEEDGALGLAGAPAGDPGNAAPPSAFWSGDDLLAETVLVTCSTFVSVPLDSPGVLSFSPSFGESVGSERCCSICCILSIMLLSARGKTGSTLPSFVLISNWPQARLRRPNLSISPRPSCRQILLVASGITGCASTVTIRKAS